MTRFLLPASHRTPWIVSVRQTALVYQPPVYQSLVYQSMAYQSLAYL